MIMDKLGVPEDQREAFLRTLHGWARSVLPGPNGYFTLAVLLWRAHELGALAFPDDAFDPSAWLTGTDS